MFFINVDYGQPLPTNLTFNEAREYDFPFFLFIFGGVVFPHITI